MSLLALIFTHLLADYPLQGEFLSKSKRDNLLLLLTHAGIWTGCILVAVSLLGFNVYMHDVLSLFIVHTIADAYKAKSIGIYKRLDPMRGGLWVDQSVHAIQLIVLMSYKGMF